MVAQAGTCPQGRSSDGLLPREPKVTRCVVPSEAHHEHCLFGELGAGAAWPDGGRDPTDVRGHRFETQGHTHRCRRSVLPSYIGLPPSVLAPCDSELCCSECSQDVIGRTLFGASFDAQSGKQVGISSAVNEGLEEIQKRISNPLRNLWWKGTERLVANMCVCAFIIA